MGYTATSAYRNLEAIYEHMIDMQCRLALLRACSSCYIYFIEIIDHGLSAPSHLVLKLKLRSTELWFITRNTRLAIF